jgi:NAD dependent epimerase/dehydratase family enzyme
MLGEMSGIVLEGCRVDIHRIRNVGYRYKYETIQQAIAAEAASE